ncbi:bifunctional diaminohydroxyphosphoribosylaminopyrimidine deaminase/5-amino-6-(5-phosphoribosylamino)uracil reductase RibD [Fimbriimonadia bacterium ATM]|nr:MAG: bifunctional diaminohydroxyphosphoribosylaminopyrimidine deaminase/5-amino-6-(5-phosphoribosylamino)uracil reductase RibD [Armatimonadota bacterium]MBC6969174.1 bifunctional diaminohydroxyphosphoribosylaminopyrimidine deaminase/5-amino-6-(5-phosphoribosylamino)uracil reductase RibD [Armatimonadota bacterium]MCE7900382.1 bifunctional diaminohydroxyphosphoribosylaminopyrimidine deaminase/5-amino-6-(5-phosphoribosylamino)uracil reductase RibD [Armatimonadetes bacterium ATM1]MDL1928273.1 bif
MTTRSSDDERWMAAAIEESRKGFPAPNPNVGCVVVRDGAVIGRGHHEEAGCAHAEAVALEQAGPNARGSTLYATLEPCNHHGRTPPCTQAILASGVQRVVIAAPDPNPIAQGGAERLRAEGVEVAEGVLREDAEQANPVYSFRFRTGRPFVLLKMGVTLDGLIADSRGANRWITGEQARHRAHELRAKMGCVLVGARTAEWDNPQLTVRAFPKRHQPLRVIVAPHSHLRPTLTLFTDSSAPTVWFSPPDAKPPGPHVSAVSLPEEDGKVAPAAILSELASKGVIGVLVEGGAVTAAQFLEAGLVDEIELHVAPKVLGRGTQWLQGSGFQLDEAIQVEWIETRAIGEDLLVRARVVN